MVGNCDFPAIVENYCRIHYFSNWDYIMERKKLLETGFLEQSIASLAKQPYMGFLLQDLASEKSFSAALKKIQEEERKIAPDIIDGGDAPLF